MKILSMTATFGKLEQATLTLESGLNILEAPNEWGKSTWCAFLVAMLYGIDTRQHTTKAALADKDRYAPWSGSPMSGTLRILWNKKDVTIQRKSKGRIPLGDFLAYETETGIPVQELNAANCGQVLLGIEKSVFLRSGFIQQSDFPVTQDESLRRRLNTLVSTADESNTGELLAQKLKELKNRCKFNRSGLLPQAEAQQEKLEADLSQLRALQNQLATLKQQQVTLETQGSKLENHRDALAYQRYLSRRQKLEAAKKTLDTLSTQFSAQELLCAALPSREEATQKLAQLRKLQEQADATHIESQMLPPPPDHPLIHPVFYGQSPELALAQAQKDLDTLSELEQAQKHRSPFLIITAFLLLLAGSALFILSHLIPALLCLGFSILLLLLALILRNKVTEYNKELSNTRQQILSKYGQLPPEQWIPSAKNYADTIHAYQKTQDRYIQSRGDLDQRIHSLRQQFLALTEGVSPSVFLQKWSDILAQWDSLEELRIKLHNSTEYCSTLSSDITEVVPPRHPDHLTCTDEETARLLSDHSMQLRQLQLRKGQLLGQMDALGDESALLDALTKNRARITQLEDTYAALILAQETLTTASIELQRRFAPRITKRTRELFSKLTGDRYDRVAMDENLELSASAVGEDVLRSALWRSSGTVDQLYLALRIAVAEALAPDAPLILDDALVRFDDQRLTAALAVLREESCQKQILLFTCQSREKQFLN